MLALTLILVFILLSLIISLHYKMKGEQHKKKVKDKWWPFTFTVNFVLVKHQSFILIKLVCVIWSFLSCIWKPLLSFDEFCFFLYSFYLYCTWQEQYKLVSCLGILLVSFHHCLFLAMRYDDKKRWDLLQGRDTKKIVSLHTYYASASKVFLISVPVFTIYPVLVFLQNI